LDCLITRAARAGNVPSWQIFDEALQTIPRERLVVND
jgi:hypothetical protein